MCDIVHADSAEMQSVSFLNNLLKQRVFICTSIVIASENMVQFSVLKQRHCQTRIWQANEKIGPKLLHGKIITKCIHDAQIFSAHESQLTRNIFAHTESV